MRLTVEQPTDVFRFGLAGAPTIGRVSDEKSNNDKSPPAAPAWATGIPAGRIFGVPLVVSPTWVVLVVFAMLVVPSALRQHVPGLGSAGSILAAFGLIFLVYGAVLVHEASHVLVAKAMGLRVGRVVLQLLGAQSEVLDEPPTPAHSYLIAAVGPLSSVFLAGVGAAVGNAFAPNTIGYVIGWSFAIINGIVSAFNLLPGLPLDGGQILRAAVWHFTRDKMKAQLIAGQVGQGVAYAIVVLALVAPGVVATDRAFGAVYLLVLAFVIWSNASIAITQARAGTAVPHLSIESFLRPALTVEAQLPLAEAVRRARAIGARALVVVDGRDRWSGIVSESAVQATPVDRQPWMSVSDLARPVEAGLVLPAGLHGHELMTAIQKTPASEYLVADSDGLLRGVLARADLVAALKAAGVR
jgi:Zn-dependent protease/CBS domain-containing protein